IADGASNEVIRSRGIGCQNPLEPAQELRHPIATKNLSTRDRLILLFVEPLIFVDRMVRIIDLLDDIGNRELDLMRPQPAVFIGWRKSDSPTQIQQDRSGVADDDPAIAQERRGERDM